MNSPSDKKIIIIEGATQCGKRIAAQMAALLAQEAGEIIIVEEYPGDIPPMVKDFMLHPMSYDFLKDIEKPKSEFEQRQEWLDGFRAKHQRRARRSRK